MLPTRNDGEALNAALIHVQFAQSAIGIYEGNPEQDSAYVKLVNALEDCRLLLSDLSATR